MSYNTILATAPLTATGYHLKATGTTIGNSLIWDNGTNVGIGNQGTTYSLDVTGSLRNTTSAYFATTSGTVGIGIAAPVGKLQVYKNGLSAVIGKMSDANILIDSGDYGNSTYTAQIAFGYYSGTFTYAPVAIGFITTSGSGAGIGDLTFNTRAAAAGDAAPTERMRITSAGYVGINNTNPASRLYVQTTAGATKAYDDTTKTNIMCFDDTSMVAGVGGSITFGGYKTAQTNGGNFAAIDGVKENGTAGNEAGAFRIWTANSSGVFGERMRITSGGNVGIGITNPNAKLQVSDGQIGVGSSGSSGNGLYLFINNALSDNSYLSRGSAGSGTTTWYIGNQAITTSSDIRLKENINDSTRVATEIINKIRIVDHSWNDPSDTCINNKNSRGLWMGLIAQEAIEHIPWLVNKPLEDKNEDGSINYWHMDFAYSVPLLMKAIQEMNTKLDEQNQTIQNLQEQINILAK